GSRLAAALVAGRSNRDDLDRSSWLRRLDRVRDQPRLGQRERAAASAEPDRGREPRLPGLAPAARLERGDLGRRRGAGLLINRRRTGRLDSEQLANGLEVDVRVVGARV